MGGAGKRSAPPTPRGSKTAHADIKKAAGDLHQINQIVKSEKGSTSSKSSAPSATATPTSAASS